MPQHSPDHIAQAGAALFTAAAADGSPRVVALNDLPSLAGADLGLSSWHEVTQEEVTQFAVLTGDEQWIHVDPERAAAGPFGSTVAHGYFTLALSTPFIYELVRVEGAALILNYGSNRVRYPAPVPVGSRVRARLEVAGVEDVAAGYQVVYRLTYEVEGQDKPGCVADVVFRYYQAVPGARR